MVNGFKTLLAVITGRAVVISKKNGNKADVLIGRELDRQFVISSMVGAIRHLML